MNNALSRLSLLLVAGTLFFSTVSKGMTQHQSMHDTAKSADKAQTKALDTIYNHDLQTLSDTVDKAIQLLQNGDSKAAMTELQRIKAATEGIRQALAAHVKTSFVNNRCPIMNSPIKPERVTKDLVRKFQGQKIAFCCGGCPAAWDRLSDTEKKQKLSKGLVQRHQAH